MTVKELKNKLANYPDSMMVFIGPRITGFSYGLLNTVCCKEIIFSEEPESQEGVLASDTVVILDEE